MNQQKWAAVAPRRPWEIAPLCYSLLFISLRMTAKCSACHSCFFIFIFFCFSRQDRERHKSQQVPREHFSQLCKHAIVLMCLFFSTIFLMTQYVSVIKGGVGEDSRGEWRDVHLQTHTHTHTLCVVCYNTCAFEKRQSSSLFHSAAIRWHPIVFPPQWISMGVTERMGLLKCHMRGH